MTVPNVPAGQDPSGSANDPTKTPPPPPPPETVPYDKFRDLLDEKKKAAQRAKDAEEKLAKIEEDKLKANGEYQKLLDAERLRSQELQGKLTEHESRQRDARKLNAFLKAAGPNLDQKWLGLVNTDSIKFKDGTEDLDDLSVSQEVDRFKKEWGEAFKPAGSMPPPNTPNGSGGGKITHAEYVKLPLKDKRKYKMSDIADL